MKNLFGFIVILLALVFASCASNPTVNYDYPHSGNVNNAAITVKDYETRGIVFVKSTEVIDSDGSRNGSGITYEMLMLEAQKLGADDIINIKIDVNKIQDGGGGSFGNILKTNVRRTTYNYTATALAIKYTESISASAGLNPHNDLNISDISVEKPQKKTTIARWLLRGAIGLGIVLGISAIIGAITG